MRDRVRTTICLSAALVVALAAATSASAAVREGSVDDPRDQVKPPSFDPAVASQDTFDLSRVFVSYDEEGRLVVRLSFWDPIDDRPPNAARFDKRLRLGTCDPAEAPTGTILIGGIPESSLGRRLSPALHCARQRPSGRARAEDVEADRTPVAALR